MDFRESNIFKGVYTITPKIFGDERGYFYESFSQREFEKYIPGVIFVQDNESCSAKGTVRGLHFQYGIRAQSKLVRCPQGKLIDVILDIRPDSPTFGHSGGFLLSADNKKQLFIPRGFAHGFIALEDNTILQYKCDNFYYPEAEGGLQFAGDNIYDDFFTLLDDDVKPIISDKDKLWPTFEEYKNQL